MTDHICHWPTCAKPVPPKEWGCKFHWFRLPNYIRRKIWRNYQPGQEITKTPSAGYINAAKAAQEWIAAEIAAGRES